MSKGLSTCLLPAQKMKEISLTFRRGSLEGNSMLMKVRSGSLFTCFLLISLTFPVVTSWHVWSVAKIQDEYNIQKRAKHGGANTVRPFSVAKQTNKLWLGFLSWKMQAFKGDNSDCKGWLKEHLSLQEEMHQVMNYFGLKNEITGSYIGKE